MSRLREALLYLALLTLWFCIFYGSSNWLAAKMPYRIPMSEPYWSFRPEWAAVYLSLNLLLTITFVVVKDRATLFTSLLLQTALAWPLFVLLPLEPLSLPSQPKSWFFQMADTVNLESNYLPSLHVSYALTCAYFLRRPGAAVWAAAICLSTILTYQHYPVDVWSGAVLAALAIGATQGRLKAFSLCLGELVRCSVRHHRYAVISVALLMHLVLRPRAGWPALVGFCYLQRVDDLLDGHLAHPAEPEEEARVQISRWHDGEWNNDELDLLGKALQTALPEQDKIVALIYEMCLDRHRVRDQQLLSEPRLKAHLAKTFSLSLDLMLAASGTDLSSKDAPSLPPLLGWCSMVRDLTEDLELGLVNVPEEVLTTGRILEWFKSEHEKARHLFLQTQTELQELRGRDGVKLLGLFHKSVEKYLRAHQPDRAVQLVNQLTRNRHKVAGE